MLCGGARAGVDEAGTLIVGRFTEWPFILIDLRTHEGIVGRVYLEPYVLGSARYIVPAIEVAAERLANAPLAPIDAFRSSVQALNLRGREGVSLGAEAALDMAIWDAFAKAANQPLAVCLGGSVGRIRAYNTNGLWLLPARELAADLEALRVWSSDSLAFLPVECCGSDMHLRCAPRDMDVRQSRLGWNGSPA